MQLSFLALAALAGVALPAAQERIPDQGQEAGEAFSGKRLPAGYTLPVIDLAGESERQVIVDREAGQYLGHPTTALLADGRTIVTVYPQGHGRGAIVLKRSLDGGLTFGERLPVPENWAGSQEVPTLHRVVDGAGQERLILFSGLYPIRMAVSEDDGRSWSALSAIGDFGGIVAMVSVERLASGDYMALFHDDGRCLRNTGPSWPRPTGTGPRARSPTS